jgi:uncharacterized protein (DUF433 family)
MAVTILHIDAIVSDPAVRGGRPVIAGTTLRVSDLAAHYVYGGMAAEELAVNFGLSLGQVHAGLAYYHLNKDAIDAEMRANAAEADDLLAEIRKAGRIVE